MVLQSFNLRRINARFRPIAATFAIATFAAASFPLQGQSPLVPDSWPQWRGPNRTGALPAGSLPKDLAPESLREQWRLPLGPSYSGPIVLGNTVFTTETHQEKFERVHAVDRASGKILWTQQWEGALRVPFFARSNGDWIRATPAATDETLYVPGMRDLLVALNTQDGTVRWTLDFPKTLKSDLPSFGYVSSPLIDGQALYTQAGGSVVKIDRSNGKILWRALEDGGGMWGSAFSSPILADLAGQKQVIVQSRTTLAGLHPDSGQVLWSTKIEAFRGMNILTPVVFDSDQLFTSSYGGKSLAFKIVKKGEVFEPQLLWENKAQAYMSTPVIIDGHAYLHLRSERLACLDLKSGQEKWTSGRSFGKYCSFIASGAQILGLDQRGSLFTFEANPTGLKVTSERKIGDDAWAHLAVSRQQVFIRELNALVAFDWSPSQFPPPQSVPKATASLSSPQP